ncbi:trypsin beta-like [Drosophila biarmipes]|uniref:trypsin beta-like n=1 Tax=Drosophila biarmipes TaxID=125945 RepID=UPI0007E7AC69|nr:trypsin beta-like [Drosophila biarmipes]
MSFAIMMPKAVPLLLGLLVLVLSDPYPGRADYTDPEEEEAKCNNKTIGGTPVDIKTAPWTASISITEKAKCAGIVYNWNYILTAARCVNGFMNKAIKVRLGSTDRSIGVTEVAVCNITIHEKFSSHSIHNNLAMLKLCRPLKATKTIKNIPLVSKFPADGTHAVSIGWASFRWWAMFWTKCLDELAHKMMKAEVKVYNHKKCLGLWPATAPFRANHPITEDLFCTNKAGNESCSFDMGSPLTVDGKVVGILTRGGCSQRPEMYTNLIHFKDWLDKHSK